MANGYSQEQVVSLNLKQCDVNTLCQEIWKQTGLRFIYNEEHVKALQAFNVQADHKQYRKCWMKYLKIPHCVISLRTILFIS